MQEFLDNATVPRALSMTFNNVKEGDLLVEESLNLNTMTLVKSGSVDMSPESISWSGYPKELREQNVNALVKMKMHLELIRTALSKRQQENCPEEVVEQIKKNLKMLKEAFRYQMEIQKILEQNGNKFSGSFGDGPSGKDSRDDPLQASPPSLQVVVSEVPDFVQHQERQTIASVTAGAIPSGNVEELTEANKGSLVSPPSLQAVASEVSDFVQQLEGQSNAKETSGAISSENFEELAESTKRLLVSPPSLQMEASEVSDFVKQLEEQDTLPETAAAIISKNIQVLVARCDEEFAKMIALIKNYGGEACGITASEGKERTGMFNVFKKHRRQRDKLSKSSRGKQQGDDNESENSILGHDASVASYDTDIAFVVKEAWTEVMDFTDGFRKFLFLNDSGAKPARAIKKLV